MCASRSPIAWMEVGQRYQLMLVFSMILSIVEGKAPVSEWTVKNQDGNICMQMQMAATLTIPYLTTTGTSNAVVDVPTNADPSVHSKCEGDSVKFDLNFFYPGWEVYLEYKKSGSKYKLDTIGVGYTIDEHFPDATGSGWSTVSISDSSLPTTPVGSYYGCDNVIFDVSGVTLALSNVKFQPYVQDVSDKGYGQFEECSTGNGLGEAVAILIIIAVALVIIVPIVVVVVCIVRRKRKKQQFDYQRQ